VASTFIGKSKIVGPRPEISGSGWVDGVGAAAAVPGPSAHTEPTGIAASITAIIVANAAKATLVSLTLLRLIAPISPCSGKRLTAPTAVS
jgi:hypothetical protein